jgi:hypothetical protein
MSSPTAVRPPPRSLPPALTLQMLFGGTLNTVGWATLTFGLVFARVFLGDWTPGDLTRWGGPLESAPGEVVEARYTNASENEVYIQEVRFAWNAPDGHRQEGVSYVTQDLEVVPGPVTVEYAAGDYEHARVAGMRSTRFGGMVFLVLIFPGIGLAMAGVGLGMGLSSRGLLVSGEVGEASLVGQRATNTRVNGRRVIAYTFAFEGPMGRQEFTVKTTQREAVEGEASERVFYDPGRPSRAALLDAMPGAPMVYPDGTLQPRRPQRAWMAGVLPALNLVLHGAWTLLG